ncbi:MAG TPA: hypothetical protein VJP78_12275, partial [Thermoleophilia bacterium]|nr:hypothetical protein [Thermoleophilia bacterium]
MSSDQDRLVAPSSRARRNPRLAFVALAFLALIWGYNWVAMKVGIGHAEPFTFASLRAFLGALVM